MSPSRFVRCTVLLALLASSPLWAADADLLARDRAWNELRQRGDAEGVAALLADDWMLTHSDGRIQDKRDYVEELRSGRRSNQAIGNREVQVREYADTAVITGISEQSGISAGQAWSGRFRFTRVWVRMQGEWRMVASHSSRIAG